MTAASRRAGLDPALGRPLHVQLFEHLRESILHGELAPGARLPSTRALQEQLGVSRNTVMEAFAQLRAEGYVEARSGSGTFVAAVIPDDLIGARAPSSRAPAAPSAALSRRGRQMVSAPTMPQLEWRRPRAFYPGVPAYELFPFDQWQRLTARHWRNPRPGALGYGDPQGHRPLREAIAEHLTSVRGVRCGADQVIVVAGSQQGLDLAARVLLDPGEAVWFEDPGYPGARAALMAAGARIEPVAVDDHGLDVAAGVRQAPQARMAYVTPAHQYPLGSALAVARRRELLQWAAEHGAWVVEDDYDSEFRYGGRMVPALKTMDDRSSVIYVGTFSKVLFPALRLGYVVVPDALVEAFTAARSLIDRHPPTAEQAVLAAFISEGHFLRHLRRMRLVYADRQATMVEQVRRRLGDELRLEPDDAGMHLVARFSEARDDVALSRAFARHGVSAPPLSRYHADPATAAHGLLLGYTGYDATAIEWGVRRMAQAMQDGSGSVGRWQSALRTAPGPT